MPDKTPQKFVWYELMTSDLSAAETFYKAVVGWTTEDFPGQDFRYVIVKAGERGIAGLMTLPDDAVKMGARPAWLGYIYADDVDQATDRLAKAGGKVHRQPADIPGVGRFSVVADPQGAMFMLITPQGEDQPPLPMSTPGNVGWHELYAADGASAMAFYADQFGWQKNDEMDMGPMGKYLLFSTGGSESAGGIMTKPAEIPHPAWGYYFVVGNIDDAVRRVTDNGGKVLNGPMEVPGPAFIIQGADPQGAMFALVGSR